MQKMQFYCRCLNIGISVNSASVMPLVVPGGLLTSQGLADLVLSSPNGKIQPDWSRLSIKVDDLKLSEDECCDPFFCGEECLIKLPLTEAVISEKNPFLVEQRSVGGRRSVYRCLLCNTLTHATSLDTRTLLIKRQNMVNDEPAIAKLRDSVNYSSAFGFVIPQLKESGLSAATTTAPDEISTPTNGQGRSLHSRKAMQFVQAQMDQYLNVEQEAMDERIRNYTELENAKFQALKGRVKQQKSMVLKLIMQHTSELKVGYEDENDSAVPLSPLSFGSGNVSPGFGVCAGNNGVGGAIDQFDNTGGCTGMIAPTTILNGNWISSLPGGDLTRPGHGGGSNDYIQTTTTSSRPKAHSNPACLSSWKRKRHSGGPGNTRGLTENWEEETVFSLDEQDDELSLPQVPYSLADDVEADVDENDEAKEDLGIVFESKPNIFKFDNHYRATQQVNDVASQFGASLPVCVPDPWAQHHQPHQFENNKENMNVHNHNCGAARRYSNIIYAAANGSATPIAEPQAMVAEPANGAALPNASAAFSNNNGDSSYQNHRYRHGSSQHGQPIVINEASFQTISESLQRADDPERLFGGRPHRRRYQTGEVCRARELKGL